MGASPRIFTEDVTLGGTTYTTGGISITVTKAAQLIAVRATGAKGTGTTVSTTVVVAPVTGSEAGQKVSVRCYQPNGSTTAPALSEYPTATALPTGLVASLVYEGT